MLKKFLKFLNLSENISITNNVNFDYNSAEYIHQLFNNDFYDEKSNNKLESWLFYNYLEHSDSLIEKKYKMLVLGLIFNQKKIYLGKMPLIHDVIKDLSKELIDQKETDFDLTHIFPILRHLPNKFYKNRFNELEVRGADLIPKILDEDYDEPEKKDILNKIYNQFSCLGLMANTFIDYKSNIDILMRLQDSKFNKDDIAVFENFITRITDSKYKGYHSIMLNMECWKILISNENEINNLNIIKQLYLNNKSRPRGLSYGAYSRSAKEKKMKNQDYLIELVEKRIEYLELNNELRLSTDTQCKKFQRAKL